MQNTFSDPRFEVVAKETYAAGDIVVLRDGSVTGPIQASTEEEGYLEDKQFNSWRPDGRAIDEGETGLDIVGTLEIRGTVIPKTHAAIMIGLNEEAFSFHAPDLSDDEGDKIGIAVLSWVYTRLADPDFYAGMESVVTQQMAELDAMLAAADAEEPLYRSEQDA